MSDLPRRPSHDDPLSKRRSKQLQLFGGASGCGLLDAPKNDADGIVIASGKQEEMNMLGHDHKCPKIKAVDGSRAVDGVGKDLARAGLTEKWQSLVAGEGERMGMMRRIDSSATALDVSVRESHVEIVRDGTSTVKLRLTMPPSSKHSKYPSQAAV